MDLVGARSIPTPSNSTDATTPPMRSSTARTAGPSLRLSGFRRSTDVIQNRYESIYLVGGKQVVWAMWCDVCER